MFGGRTKELGGMMTMPKEMGNVPPNWNIYFRIPDANAGAERVKANGGKILNGPMDVPDGDRVLNATDPQGAAFGLHAKKM
jgi:predicted enzyme related to lactoylglutathione lyase